MRSTKPRRPENACHKCRDELVRVEQVIRNQDRCSTVARFRIDRSGQVHDQSPVPRHVQGPGPELPESGPDFRRAGADLGGGCNFHRPAI